MKTLYAIAAAVLAALFSTQAVAEAKNTNAASGPFAWHATKSSTTISRMQKPIIHIICATSAPAGTAANVQIKLLDDSWKTIELQRDTCLSVKTTRVKISSSGKDAVDGNYALMP